MRTPDDLDPVADPALLQVGNRSRQHIAELLQGSQARDTHEVSDAGSPAGITRDILASVMSLLATPVLLVDRQLSIIYANASAVAILGCGNPLSIDAGQLQAAEAELSKLKSVIGLAVRGGPMPAPLVLEPSKVGRRAGALCVWIHPIDRLLQTSAPLWAQGLVALVLKPLCTAPVISTSLFRSRYALTARQADVVKMMAAGATIEQTAAALGVSVPTVRSHLAQCFAKTGTHRQPDLIGLALSFTSPIFE